MAREKNWTPGPWEATDIESDIDFCQPDNDDIAILNERMICPAIVWGGLSKESIANAHLIAAAPELLEAMEGLIDEIDDDCESIGSSYEVDMARSAIAKAYGESHG